MKIEDEGAERRTVVTCADGPRRVGGAATVPSAWSLVRGTAIHVVSVVACYSALYILFFAPVLFNGRLLGAGDLIYYLPNFIRGTALWDPLLLGGFPVAADPQAMTWYPLSMLFAARGSWNGFVVSAYVLGSCFAYGYVYTLTGSRLAAAVSGTVYGMSGFLMASLGHATIVHAAAWMPLLIWAVEGLAGGSKMLWPVVGTVAVACCVLSGHPQISVYTLGLGAFYTLIRCWCVPAGRARLCGLYTMIVALGLGVAALQLLPAAELARLSLRSEMTFTDFVSYSLPFRQSITLLFPYLFGTEVTGDVYSVAYFGAPDAGFTGYMGLLTLMLAMVGVLAPFKRAVACFWAAVGLFAFLLVLGDFTSLAKVMYSLPVVNKFRAPTRHFIECAFALSVLAGLGVAAIKNRAVTAKLTAVVVAASGATILFSVAVILWRADTLKELAAARGIDPLSVLPWSNPAVGIPLVVFGFGAAILLAWRIKPASTLRTSLLLVGLVVDLGSCGWFSAWSFTSPHRDIVRPPEIAQRYRTTLEATHQRIAPVRGALGSREEIPPNLHRLWGVPSVSGYGPLLLARVSEVLSMGPDGDIAGLSYMPDNRTLDIMGVSHVFAPVSAFTPLTAKSQGISWARERMALGLGAGCGVTRDAWRLQLSAPVKVTALGMVTSLGCATATPDNTEVLSVAIMDSQGRTHTYAFRAGRDTSEWAFDCADVRPQMKHRRASVFLSFPVVRRGALSCQGHQYVGMLGFGREIEVKALDLTWTGLPAHIGIEKITLHNENTALSYPVSEMAEFLLNPDRWRLVQEFGETRVYANTRSMPRAWLVPETVTLQPDQVLSALRSSRLPDGRPFDPAQIALVEEPLELKGGADATAEAVVERVTDTVVEVRTRSSAVSFLILSDVFYPGWSVTIDGVPSRLYQTDYVLRGAVVPAGAHLVKFAFTPRTFYAGLGISVLASVITIGIPIVGMRRGRRDGKGTREGTHGMEH